jgi:hypothetical protein
MKVLSTTLLAGLLAMAGVAGANTPVARGYGNCIDDLEAGYPRQASVVHARYYYHARSSDEMTYFVNSSAWQDGDRVTLRTRCLTDRFGRDLLMRETFPGRWTPERGIVTVEELSSR